MRVLGILGSPRVGGNSDILLDQALTGAKEAGAGGEGHSCSRKRSPGALTAGSVIKGGLRD